MSENEDFIFLVKSLLLKIKNAPNLEIIFSNIQKNVEQLGKKEIHMVMQNISLCLLDVKYRNDIVMHMKPWLLEILNYCIPLIGSFKEQNFNITLHSSFCVCLSKLLNKDVTKLALRYFEDAPSPYYHLENVSPPANKRIKYNIEVPDVKDLDIIEATYILLSTVGVEIASNWDYSVILEYVENDDEAVRWYACNILALIVKMNEEEKENFVLKHVSAHSHNEMLVLHKIKMPLTSLCSSNHVLTRNSCCQFTHKIGKVILPLHQSKEILECEEILVPLTSTQNNLEAIALGMSSCQPVLIEGQVGSGKTSLVEHLGVVTGRSKAPELSKIQLSDQTDSKTLIGTYRCTANPGEFIWQAGSLTQAVMNGYWLLLEDIDFAPLDVISLLIPLLESRILPVPGHGNIKAHPSFQLFATRRTLPAGCRMKIGASNLIEKLWAKVVISSPTADELKYLICTKFQELTSIADKLVEVFSILSSQHKEAKAVERCQECSSFSLKSKMVGRLVSIRDLMKWCSRMVCHIKEENLNNIAFQEALDCFCSAIPDPEKRKAFAFHIGSHLNLNEPIICYYLYTYRPEISNKKDSFSIGSRGEIKRIKHNHVSFLTNEKSVFSKTRLASCLLEKVAVAVMNEEPILLVGETGTGKTSTVQYLANKTNHPLKVINMNQQSDSSDLLGGFKPVEIRTVVNPLKIQFEDLFVNTFSAKKNTKFLCHIAETYERQRWNDLFVLMDHSTRKGIEKVKNELISKNSNSNKKKIRERKKEVAIQSVTELKNLLNRWEEFEFKVENVKDQIQKVKSSLAFAFIEGTLVKAVQQGDWVLLDEINLASADTLECLSGLLDNSLGSLTLHERGDSKPVIRNSDFRLFACMNPATDVGKKELPVGLRNRFTEFFVEEVEETGDLKQIVQEYLQEHNPSPKQISEIVKLYKKLKEESKTQLTDSTGHRPHFSLRTLCRALIVTKRNYCKSISRNLHEAFSISFLTQLSRDSYKVVSNLIVKTFCANTKIILACPGNPNFFTQVEGFWIAKGDKKCEVPKKYILTTTVRANLKDLARIVSIGKFPVLLQGDTSVGKTSLISYLANLTGNTCVRINNHQHTDLQEYLGSYAPDETGKLVFQEGVLVTAMRKGHWIILDELNLAPSDVLEALNRLLDDNRELFIPEIETVVKAHPNFMLFATQNPPGLYGGRQVLSRAFRNRFVELHFDVIPSDELQVILKERCDIPETLSKKMVLVLQDLQNQRRTSNLYQGKQSFITLRELFRWAERYRVAPPTESFYDWDQHMADEGYLVIAAKTRIEDETKAIKAVLKKRLKREVDVHNLFTLSANTSLVTKSILEILESITGFEHIVWTYDMRRLFVLVSKALSFCEPVLLVGDTGCGKTTVCQMISTIRNQKLYTVNCHMHTEGADFLGGLRPVRERVDNDDRLFEWVDGPLVQSMKEGGMLLADEISLADDSVLERLNSVLEPERTLVLSEKASGCDEKSLHLQVIVAMEEFRLIGTMNPGGDYGKKELSPALRNRFTEIWCPKVDINRSLSDIKLIISHNISKSIKHNLKIEDTMLHFLKHFAKTEVGKKITISIRDILSWVSFINKVTSDEQIPLDIGMAYVHGACLVFLDSLGSGATGNTAQTWKKLREKSLKFLCLQYANISMQTLNPSALFDVQSFILKNDEEVFGIEPFLIPKGNSKSAKPLQFSFKAPKTCLNLLRVLRGLQLSRPILLEGSPGVGKTSLVISLAKASSNDIIRINLSEQTDVSDLFGADLPVEGSEGGRFAWRDGPLLRALRSGSWIVFDELNLASQSVLEGLNACFDHRGEIFVPELNKTFYVQHQTTKIFACQNPQFEGGARKGLPKSFLNRFTQVYIEPLSSFDFEFILESMHPEIPPELISKMVEFNGNLVSDIQERKLWGTKGGPWELNLRDLFRWCEIMLSYQQSNELNPGSFVELIYADRMRMLNDKEEVFRAYENVFSSDKYPLYRKSGTFYLSQKYIQAGNVSLKRKINGNENKEINNNELLLLQNQTPYIESLINCINMNWMALLVGGSGEGKTSVVRLLADLSGQKLENLSVNSHMDVTELLGGFEQADYGRSLTEIVEELQKIVFDQVRCSLLSSEDIKDVSSTLALWKDLCSVRSSGIKRTTSEDVHSFMETVQNVKKIIDHLKKKEPSHSSLKTLKKMQKTCIYLSAKVKAASAISGSGTFEWVDSPLVKAVRDGHWILIDGVNLCSPSVLDRLNGLLEPGGVLVLNERGVIGHKVPTITPHPNFRLFLTMDPLRGEISRAMRNRGIEIYMQGMGQNDMDIQALLASKGLTDSHIQKYLSKTHFAICDILPVHQRPGISCLLHTALFTTRLMELGNSVYDATSFSLELIYVRNFAQSNQKKDIQLTIENSMKDLKTSTTTLKSLTLPPISYLFLNSKTLNLSSSLGLPVQLATLVEIMHRFQTGGLPKLSFPEEFPASVDNFKTAIYFCLSLIPFGKWSIFDSTFRNLSKNKTLINAVHEIVESEAPISLQILDNVCDGELPFDPRYTSSALNFKIDNTDEFYVISLSNKSLIYLWMKINNLGQFKKSEKKNNSRNRSAQSILELSHGVSKGIVGEKMIYHASLKYLYPFLQMIDNLITSLSDDTEIRFGNQDYFKFRDVLLWKKRLEDVCEKVVSKQGYHLFLPTLVFHWKQIQNKLLEEFPANWQSIAPEGMEEIVEKLKHSFSTHCSPIHQLVPEFRNWIGYPLPFTTKLAGNVYIQLLKISDYLIPCIGNNDAKEIEKSILLGSDDGEAVKRNLIDTAFDISKFPVSDSAFIRVDKVEKMAHEHLSKIYPKDRKSAISVKLLPLIDYLVSRQLSVTNIGSELNASQYSDILAKSSRIPILICDSTSSKSLMAVACYMFNYSNCAVVKPSMWLNFDLSLDDIGEYKTKIQWDGEEHLVLSPMGNILTYILLNGYNKPIEEMGFMCVGNHSEREFQLGKIRKTMWVCWDFLSKPELNFTKVIKVTVEDFTNQLLKSLLSVMNIGCTEQLKTFGLEKTVKKSKNIVSCSAEVFGAEIISLLKNIIEVSENISASDDGIVDIAKLGIYSGLLQTLLLSHIDPLDPAKQREILLSYCGQEYDEIQDNLRMLKWIRIIMCGQSHHQLHPHWTYFSDKLEQLESEKIFLSENVSYRPSPSQYNKIREDIAHFIQTLFAPSRIIDLMNLLIKSCNDKAILHQCEGMLRSCDNFINKLVMNYPLYRDIIIPMLHGVVTSCECLRILMVTSRNCSLTNCMKKLNDSQDFNPNIDEVLTRMLYFPYLRNHSSPQDFLTQFVMDQKCIFSLVSEFSSSVSYPTKCQSLSLRASLYDLLNAVSSTLIFTRESFSFFKCLIESVILWWREYEEERKRKHEEEESLFIYKSRTLAISETEEEEIEREYLELFPDYQNEFDDLDRNDDDGDDNDDDSMKELSDDKDEECSNVKLSEEQLNEVIELHKFLAINYTDALWISAGKDISPKTLTPLSLRVEQVQLLMRCVGPYAMSTVDAAGIGALIVTNQMACSSAKSNLNMSVTSAPFNYYQDPELNEALKVRPLLENLEKEADRLLETWPSHPSLLMIKKVINRVLGFSVSSPLIRLVIGLEMVLEKSHEWERNAHRGVSLMEVLSPITEQVIEWRKMELKAWNSCLDMITFKVSKEANKFWPHLYESFLSANLNNVDEITQVLKQFMESSLLGNFKTRLDIIRAFHSHLILEHKYCSQENRELLSLLIATTWNFFKYYSQFLPSVENAIQMGRKPIEKQVKDFIKILKWNDINFFSVRDSVIKSRRTLHRHMRNWEKVLRQPLSPFLMNKNEDISRIVGEWDTEKESPQNCLLLPSTEIGINMEITDDNSLVSRLRLLTKKSCGFISKSLKNIAYQEHIEAVEEFTEEIITNYHDLLTAAAKAENLSSKEERMKNLKEIMNRKMKSFASLFKALHHRGLSYTKGINMWKDDDLDKCLIVPPLDLKVALQEADDYNKLPKKYLVSCEKYYYQIIGRQALLLKSLHQAHADLCPEDIKRLKGCASFFLILNRELRQALPDICSSVIMLDHLLNELEKATLGFLPVQREFCDWWNKVYYLIVSLSQTLDEEIELLKTYPNCDAILELQPSECSFTESDVQLVLANLLESASDVKSLIHHCFSINKSLSDELYVKLSSSINVKEVDDVFSRLSVLSEKISSSIKIFDKNFVGNTSLTNPLIVWLDEWKKLHCHFTGWKGNLVYTQEENYSFSSEIEVCLTKILKSIEDFYKHHNKDDKNSFSSEEKDDPSEMMISDTMAKSILIDYENLRCPEIIRSLRDIIDTLSKGNTSLIIPLKSMSPILQNYLTLSKNILIVMMGNFRSLSKLHSVLLGIFQELAIKGFCRPQELQDEEGNREGANQFQDSGPGLSEGEGQKDVSERIESEDQVESALQEGEKEKEGDKTLKEENGIEMSQDFEGCLQDVERTEEEGKGSDDEEEEEEQDFDKQMGDVDKGADKLDEKLWGEEEEENDEENEDNEKENEDPEHGPGDYQTAESEIVAKDDNKNKKEKDNKENQKKELETMEEDKRESVQEEEGEETYDDNFKDKLGGENQGGEEGEDEPMELPEDLNLDDNENDKSDAEDDSGMNPEIEEKGLFPEEGKEPNENDDEETNEGNENDETEKDDEDITKDGEERKEECQENQDSDKGEKEKEGNIQRMTEEEDKDGMEPGEEVEKAIPSKDLEATEAAQAADMETKEASKDKTKDEPESATGAQPDQDDEMKQEEQGQVGEQTDDKVGVGKSDSKTKEDSHRGETSALTNEEEAAQKTEEQNRPRKPGDVKQTRSLGQVEKEVHQGLMTKDRSGSKEEEEAKKDADEKEEENKDEEGKESSLYEHIGKADDHFDKQTVDVGTQEDAKLVPAPMDENEEEKKEQEEPEGISDTLMEDKDEIDDTAKEDSKKREAETDGNEGPNVKRKRGEVNPEVEEEMDYQLLTEGEAVEEMLVQRPMLNEIHTQVEEVSESELAAVFSDDLIGTRERVEECGEGNIEEGSKQWMELEGRVSTYALELCEQLRLILEPTEAAKLKGDYRTGKRLNMRKIIPYIASQFRKDKIWLRRSHLSKRSYQVLLAVDDSESMSVVSAENLARESVALVAKALTLLEVGQVGVVSFGTKTKLLHDFNTPFTDHAGEKVFGNLKFDQRETNFAQMLEDAAALLSGARSDQSVDSDTAQLLLIISDGQTHARSEAVKKAVRAAREARVFIFFLVVDALDNKYSFYDHLVYEDGQVKSMVETFPFPFFLVVRQLDSLPDAIATALRQWFELVTADAH